MGGAAARDSSRNAVNLEAVWHTPPIGCCVVVRANRELRRACGEKSFTSGVRAPAWNRYALSFSQYEYGMSGRRTGQDLGTIEVQPLLICVPGPVENEHQ